MAFNLPSPQVINLTEFLFSFGLFSALPSFIAQTLSSCFHPRSSSVLNGNYAQGRRLERCAR